MEIQFVHFSLLALDFVFKFLTLNALRYSLKFCLFSALHLQERYIVAFEEKEDLIKVSGAVQPVVEQIQVHLGRQKLNS